MAYSVNKVEMWSGEIDDQVGGLATKLEMLAKAGADLEIVVARRQPNVPGKGVVFLGPVTGANVVKAAEAVGLKKTPDLAALRVEAPNKAGEGSRVARKLAAEGINLRGFSAAVVGNKCVFSLAFDDEGDASKASRILRADDTKR
jgi:hypothetical protein